MTIPREHYLQAVFPTPFHPRTAAANTLNAWHRWRDYTVADAYFDVGLEYTALRNACTVFDLSPMTKLQRLLAAGTPIHAEDVHKALALLKSLETPLIKEDWHRIKACLTTEMLSIEFSEMGMAA